MTIQWLIKIYLFTVVYSFVVLGYIGYRIGKIVKRLGIKMTKSNDYSSFWSLVLMAICPIFNLICDMILLTRNEDDIEYAVRLKYIEEQEKINK